MTGPGCSVTNTGNSCWIEPAISTLSTGPRRCRTGSVARFPLDKAITVESVPALNDAIEQYHLSTQATLRESIEAADRAVVESYSNVARPISALDVDVVAVVEPTRVRLYDGTRFDRACDVAPGGHATGPLEDTVSSVTTLLDATDDVSLSPLPAAVRDDPAAIVEAYHDLYERLLALAAP